MNRVRAQNSYYDGAHNAHHVARVFERKRHGQYAGAEAGLQQVRYGFDKSRRAIKRVNARHICVNRVSPQVAW